MAQCKECLHYGVCAKEGRLVQVDEHTWDEYNLLPNVEQFCASYFTADVVPKSEYEKLIGKLECLLCHATEGRLSKHTYDLRTMETVVTDCANETYNDGFGEGYKECASEIFEEIDELLVQNATMQIATSTLHCKLAELKKKYTESEDKP